MEYLVDTRHCSRYWDVSVKEKKKDKNSCLPGVVILAKEDTQKSVKIVNKESRLYNKKRRAR